MTKAIVSFIALILSCGVHGEPPASGYSINGEASAYDYTNSLTSDRYYSPTKSDYRSSSDIYTGGGGGSGGGGGGGGGVGQYSMPAGLQTSIGSPSYDGFSGQPNGYSGYPGNIHESVPGNSYSLDSPHAASNVGGYATSSSNAESTYDAYTGGQGGVDLNQYPGNTHGGSSFAGYSGEPGTGHAGGGSSGGFTGGFTVSSGTPMYNSGSSLGSSLGSYSEGGPRTHSFDYSGASAHPAHSSSHSSSHSPSYASPYLSGLPGEISFGKPSSLSGEFAYGKHKEAGGKYGNDVYSAGSDMRLLRGGHGGVHAVRASSPAYSSSLGSPVHFPAMHGAGSTFYTLEKVKKHGLGKYSPSYSSSGAAFNARDHEADYAAGASYPKGSGKIIVIKEGPGGYGHAAAMQLAAGGYKTKGAGGVGAYTRTYPSSHNFVGGFSASSYGDAQLSRGYTGGGGGGHGTRHAGVYPAYS